MKRNPIYRREVMTSARSFKLALVLLLFNGILALVAVLNLYSTLEQVRLTAEVQYTSFLNLYMFVAILEFVMVIFLMPALTAGSISGERERRTLELMMTTKMTPADIIFGKLAAALSTMVLLIVSSFPVLAMVFVYGGVTAKDVLLLLACYAVSALFAGSIGISCSAFFKRTTVATVVSYGILAMAVLGTYLLNQVVLYFAQLKGDAFLVSVGTAEAASSGGFLYLLLLNPTATFAILMTRLAGIEFGSPAVMLLFGNHNLEAISHNVWVSASIFIQLAAAGFFLWMAVRTLSRSKG